MHIKRLLMDHSLKGLWVVRYYRAGLDPYKSMMDMDIEAAAKHNEHYCGYSTGHGSRKYIEDRQSIETWLAAQASVAGIEPENKKPLYFVLSREKVPVPHVRIGQTETLSIPLENIPSNLVSFTFDDSYYNHMQGAKGEAFHFTHPMHGKVLNGRQFADALAEHGWVPEREPGSGTMRYIEAQLWTRRIADFVSPAALPSRPMDTPPSASSSGHGCG
jgi:hypothetical protein